MAQKRNRRPRPETIAEDTPLSTGTSTTATNAAPNLLPDPQTYANVRRQRRSPRTSRWMSVIDCLGYFIALGIVVLFGMLIWEVVIPSPKQRVYTGVLGVTLIPVLLAALTAFRRNKPLHERVTPITFVFAIVSGFCPVWLNAGVAAIALFLLGWVTRPGMMVQHETATPTLNSKNSDDEKTTPNNHKKALPANSQEFQSKLTKTAGIAILMCWVLLTENFFIWVVSATNEKGHNPATAPEPLQDNGRRVLQALFSRLEFTKRDVVSLRRVWNVQYALVAALGVALTTADFHPTRQLWSLASRGLLTMTSARVIRTISFLMTVLPSQNKHCYIQHYPPPPALWWDWLMVGMTPAANGGCNDLIVSGHATVTTSMTCVIVSLANDNWFGMAVAWLLAMDYLVEVYEGFHYSVDMWMGAVLCSLLWRVWKPIEDNNTDRNAATLQDMMQRFQSEPITIRDAVTYGSPALIAYLQVTALPHITTNYVLMGVTSFCVIQLVMNGLQHYTRHLLFCVLYLGFGVYL